LPECHASSVASLTAWYETLLWEMSRERLLFPWRLLLFVRKLCQPGNVPARREHPPLFNYLGDILAASSYA
jgi:hypothetical protein